MNSFRLVKDFSTDYTTFYNDNLPFRTYLIFLNSGIDYFCFKRSSNEQVILGDDNWLFYNDITDGDPMACYQGTNLYTDDELAALAQNCVSQRDFLQEQGKEFVIFIAPNKERVYAEHMPEEYGKPADNYRALQIYEYLQANTDLRVVYPYTELMDTKEILNENIWYKTDTHWNYIGGYVGASALLSELGIEIPRINSEKITINRGERVEGDLAKMLLLSIPLSFVDRDYMVEGFDTHDCVCRESDFFGMWSYHATNADKRSIYVIRDSFCTHMVDYLGSQFTDSYLRHKRTYSYDDLVTCDPDIVVYETVERYAGDLSWFSIQ